MDRVIWSAFIFAALLTGLAGVLMTARLDSAVTTEGQGIGFSAFAAAVIGGVSLGGGRGPIARRRSSGVEPEHRWPAKEALGRNGCPLLELKT